MKSKLLALLAAGLLAVTGASAATVTFTDLGLPRPNGGGPFKATTSDLGSFTVFCLERSELLDFNVPYNYTVSGSAEAGGIAGGNPDPLSQGSAWLMAKYAGMVNASNSVALQVAFWLLEDELNVAVVTVGNAFFGADTTNAFYLEAQAFFGGNARATATSQYLAGLGIAVMNPTDIQTGAKKQSVIFRVPDSGTTLILLAAGLGFVGLIRRRTSL
jgi:hypothetical protein